MINKNILITGGSGFVGINLIRFLLRQKFNSITSLDIMDFDYPEKGLINHHNCDIRDKNVLINRLKGIDCVIHAAAALPSYKKSDIYSTDVGGTSNLLEAASYNGVSRFVYISTNVVYGIPDSFPIDENYELKGKGDYALAKIESEKKCEEFRGKEMCITILRPNVIIGPERLGVFSIFYDWVTSKKNFPLIGMGDNIYQMLDVEDLCDAILLSLKAENEIANDNYNIAGEVYATMREDYQAVMDYAGYGKRIIGFPHQPVIWIIKILEYFHISPVYSWIYETAAIDYYVSIEKAKSKLGYEPAYSNKMALIRNYKWYCENNHKYDNKYGNTHRDPWKQGILQFIKIFF